MGASETGFLSVVARGCNPVLAVIADYDALTRDTTDKKKVDAAARLAATVGNAYAAYASRSPRLYDVSPLLRPEEKKFLASPGAAAAAREF